MKQLARLKEIYLMLCQAPQTIESIQAALKAMNLRVSNRQIYRDLEDVGQYFLKAEERLELKNQEFNRKIYCITTDTDTEGISTYDIDTYLLSKLILPIGIEKGRDQSIIKFRKIFANYLSGSKVAQNSNWDGLKMSNTHFNEIPFDEKFQTKLDQILWSVANHRIIEIIEYVGDSVSLYRSITFPFTFQPMKLIYHRGGFFVAGLIETDKRCLVLDIFQISVFKLSNKAFPFKKDFDLLEDNLSGRFGITQNVSEAIYEVKLEFNATTGKYVMAHIWHHSQRFEEHENGNIILYLTCGINRELLGWINMWMNSVRIAAPQILKDYYIEQHRLVQLLNDSDHLEYQNVSQPE